MNILILPITGARGFSLAGSPFGNQLIELNETDPMMVTHVRRTPRKVFGVGQNQNLAPEGSLSESLLASGPPLDYCAEYSLRDQHAQSGSRPHGTVNGLRAATLGSWGP